MGGGQSLGDLPADPEDLGHGQRASGGPMGSERLPLEQLHHDVGQSFVLADRMDREEMRVLDRRGGPALPEKPTPGIRIAGPVAGQHLDRHPPVEPVIVSQVDPAHRAGADQAQDSVAADHGRQRIVCHAAVGRHQA